MCVGIRQAHEAKGSRISGPPDRGYCGFQVLRFGNESDAVRSLPYCRKVLAGPCGVESLPPVFCSSYKQSYGASQRLVSNFASRV